LYLSLDALPEGATMTAIAAAFSRVVGTDIEVEALKIVVMFCAVGLTVSAMVASYGVDLSAGFF
jgi:hypothetical protein